MPVHVRGTADPVVDEVVRVLEAYSEAAPAAEVEIYRHSPYSVRVRVIDPAFTGLGYAERSKRVWPLLRQVPEEPLSELSLVILIAPEERDTSFASLEFDHPVPATLP